MSLLIDRRQVVLGLGAAAGINGIAYRGRASAWTMSQGLPDNLVVSAATWLMHNFGAQSRDGLRGTGFPPSLACAIACQESGYEWFKKKFRQNHSPAQVLRLMVLDNVTPRQAFPRDTATFQKDRRVGHLSADLIAASDASRAARGYSPTGKLLFGYGIFQYDLQHILTDRAFWEDRDTMKSPNGAVVPVRGRWHDIDVCVDRLVAELSAKRKRHPDSMFETIRAYNGAGSNARAYAQIITRFQSMIRRSGLTD